MGGEDNTGDGEASPDTTYWLELSEGRDAGKRLLYWEAVVRRWDPTAKEEVLDQWRDALPQLEGHVTAFENRGHFIEEREPAAVARAIGDVAGLG